MISPFRRSWQVNVGSDYVMLDTLAGDARHSNCEGLSVKVLWGTE